MHKRSKGKILKFKVGDQVRIKKIEVSPDRFLGQSGMIGLVTSAPGVNMAILGDELEFHYTVDLWWPHDPNRVESESFPESYLELRSE
jgi:hypothetical protein